MRLSYISVAYFRSITNANKIDLSNLTVLLGKNNEGKTNIIKAILLGMDIIYDVEYLAHRRKLPKALYDWREDYPLSIQNKKVPSNKTTKIRFDFSMTEDEAHELSGIISSNINRELSIYIEINENNTLSITVPKKGKNAKAISNKIVDICSYIVSKFSIQYIPAIRTVEDAYDAIADMIDVELSSMEDKKYDEALEYIEKKQRERLDLLEKKVQQPLKVFLPKIQSVKLYLTDKFRKNPITSRKTLNIEMNDGVLTSLANKGDGIKSLTTIALLSQITSSKQRLIIVDEPENHLHPEAVRYINSVLSNLTIDNQVLISTHSPIFVNRENVNSNIIVEGGNAIVAKRIDEIRKTLGVICSDNLMYADYVIIVEGKSDQTVLTKFINEDDELKKYIGNNIITVRCVGGTNNLESEVYALQRYCCNYLIILDYDTAGKNSANSIKQKLSVPSDKIRFFMRGKYETEMEDLINPNIYREMLLRKGVDISNSIFKNNSIKWSDKLTRIASLSAIDFSLMEDECKENIANCITSLNTDFLTEEGQRIFKSIIEKIKNDINSMNNV